MEPGGPREDLAKLLAAELPCVGYLSQAVEGSALDACGLRTVDVVAFGEPLDGAVTNVFVADTAKQIVEDTLSQGTGTRTHLFESRGCRRPR